MKPVSIATHGAAVKPNADVQALINSGWAGTNSDIDALNKLSAALMSSSTLSSAKAANKLLVAPMTGSNKASRLMCLYHPNGVGTQMTTSLPDANVSVTGIKGDGTNIVDTLWNGSGLGWQNNTLLVHGRFFQTLYADANNYIVYGDATTLNKSTFIYHSAYGAAIFTGCTYTIGTGGYCKSPAKQAGTIASVCLGNGTDKQRCWHDNVLVSATTQSGTYGQLGQGTTTFKLLGNGAGQNSTSEIQTFILCPGIPDAEYPSVYSAVAEFNSFRKTFPVSSVNSPKKIWIVAGQSNAGGQQTTVGTSQNASGYVQDEPHENIYQVMRTGANAGTIKKAILPFDSDPGSGVVGIGPAMSFAQALLATNPNQQIVIVPAAKGASGFSSNDWNPGNTTYEAMVSMVLSAMSAGATIGGFIWCQGEGDTSLTELQYQNAFGAMFSNFASRIPGGWPTATAKILIMQVANPTWYRDSMYQAMESWNINAKYVTGSMAGLNSLSDEDRYDDAGKIHYSAKSQRMIGYALASFVNN